MSKENIKQADANTPATSNEATGGQPQKSYVHFDPGPVTMDSGLKGVKLDFNYGARIVFPDDADYHTAVDYVRETPELFDKVKAASENCSAIIVPL